MKAKPIIFAVVVFVVGLALFYLAFNTDTFRKDDPKLAGDLNSHISDGGDCRKFLADFKDRYSKKPEVQELHYRLLVECFVQERQYPEALKTIDKLEDVYKKNPKIPKYLDTDSYRQQAKAESDLDVDRNDKDVITEEAIKHDDSKL